MKLFPQAKENVSDAGLKVTGGRQHRFLVTCENVHRDKAVD